MPADWVNVFDAQRDAERKLEPGPRGYFLGGAGDEVTMRENITAWHGWRLRPRQVEAVAGRATILVGRPTAWGLAAELELTPALLGLASPADLGPEHLRSPLPTRVYSEDVVPGNPHS